MEPVTFRSFPRLPYEIREHIWRLALPPLTVEFTARSGTEIHDVRVPCSVPPPLSRACRESYKVASDYGFIDGKPNPVLIIDNQCRPYTPPDEWIYRSWNPKPERAEDSSSSPSVNPFTVAKRRNMPITFRNPVYLPTLWANGVDPKYRWEAMEKRLYKRFDTKPFTNGSQKTSYRLALTITLHRKEPGTLKPGLFGDYGQNPVQIVSAQDTARIDHFYHMWKSESCYREPRVWPIFEYLSQEARFDRWLRDMPQATHESSETRLIMSLVKRWALEAEQGQGAPGQGEAASRALAAYEAGPGDDGTLVSSALMEEQQSLSAYRENYQTPWPAKLDSRMPVEVGKVAVVFQACYKGCCFCPAWIRRHRASRYARNLPM